MNGGPNGAVADPAGGGVNPPSPVAFTMPVAPSTNKLFKNVRGKGRVKTPAYNDWLFLAKSIIRRQKVPAIDGYIGAIFNIEIGDKLSDLDNRLKAMLDVIKKAGVIEDDRFVTFIALAKMPKADGLAWVHLYPANQEYQFAFRPSHDGARGGWFSDAPQPNGDIDGHHQSIGSEKGYGGQAAAHPDLWPAGHR